MSLPDGVTTCLLTYGPITDTFGNTADSITVEVVADRTIVHGASGRTLFKSPVAVVAAPGGVAQLPVPHTNQSGFRDQQQNALTGWYYTVRLTARFAGGSIETDTKTFQPLVGQSAVDADLLPSDGMVTPGVTAPVAAVTSVAGQTGVISADQIADAVSDGILPIVAKAIVGDPDFEDSVGDAVYVIAYDAAAGVVGSQVPSLISAATTLLDTQARAAARARATVVRSVAFVGDSLTDNNGEIGSNFKNWLPLLTRGRVTRAQKFATAGYTIREWLTSYTATIQGLTSAQTPGRAHIMLGTNDVGRGGYNLATSQADLIELYNLFESKGILPIACTIPPRNDSAQSNIPAYNTMVKAVAAERGYLVMDHYAAMVNGSSGIDSTYMRTSDPVHLNAAGYEKDVLALFDDLRRTAPIDAVPTAGITLRKRNLATNGLFATTGGKYNGTPSQPDYPLNWETSSNSPATFVTDTQTEGRWCKFAAPSANTLHQGHHGIGVVVPGNRYRVSCLLRLSGTETDDFPGGGYHRSIGVEFRTAAGGSPALGTDTIFPNGAILTRNLGARVLQYVYEGVAPAGSGRVTTNISIPIGAFVEVGELEVVDLTAQSLG